MKPLSENETVVAGGITQCDGKLELDQNARRVDWLAENQLEFVARDNSGWETLFRDPIDGRFWERTYQNSEHHGAGVPTLTHLSPDVARKKYDFG